MKDYSRLLTEEIVIDKTLARNELTEDEKNVLQMLVNGMINEENQTFTDWETLDLESLRLSIDSIFIILDSLEQKGIICYDEEDNRFDLQLKV